MATLLSRWLPAIELRAEPLPRLGGARSLGRAGEAPAAAAGRALVVGTIRMGYGHYRMGRAAVTWGLRAGADVFVHDPLSIESIEASLLKASERAYCAASRLSASLGGAAERAWGRLMKSGGPASQAASRSMALRLERLMRGLPADWPVIGAHPWNSHLAVVCGSRRVVNLVPDSYPQHFLVVPEALNLAQNEESRQALLRLGVRPERAKTAGHWVPAELAENAEADAGLRLARLRRGAALRLLFSLGGAGGQAAYIEDLLGRLAPRVRNGRLRVLINAGDHAGVAARLERSLKSLGLSLARERGEADLAAFLARHPLGGGEPARDVSLFSFEDPLDAVISTDRLLRVADALATKPSELAFFPLPKLHIRRIGDHEAAAARYSAALGDGTPEQREPSEAAAVVERWLEDRQGLAALVEGVRAAAGRGVYSGARAAVDLALAGQS